LYSTSNDSARRDRSNKNLKNSGRTVLSREWEISFDASVAQTEAATILIAIWIPKVSTSGGRNSEYALQKVYLLFPRFHMTSFSI
jgi:hypothetical protein